MSKHSYHQDADRLPATMSGHHRLDVYNPYVLSGRDDDEPDLRWIWHIIKKYRFLILSAFMVSTVTALIFTLMMRPVYRATALVELKPNPAVVSVESMVRNQRVAQEFRNTQIKLLQTEAVTKRVIEAMDLDQEPEFTGELKQRGLSAGIRAAKRAVFGFAASVLDKLSLRDAFGVSAPADDSTEGAPSLSPEALEEREILRQYLSRLSVSPVEESDLVYVSFESFSAHRAAELANAHTWEYIRFIDERRFNSTSSAKKYLQGQIEEAEGNLEASEKALNDFARENNVVDVEDRGNVMQRGFEDLSRALTASRQERIMAQFEYKQAQQRDIETLPAVLSNNMIQELRGRYADLRAQYEEMSRVFKDNYPEMKQLIARMSDLKATLREESEKIAAGLQRRYEQLRNQERELAEELSTKRTELLDLKERAIEYNILKREWEASRELYAGLLERQKDFSVATGMEFNDASVVDPAVVPTGKHKPDNVRNVGMAAVFGVAGGIGIAFLLAFLNNTFSTREELEEALGIPFMGIVPKVKGKENQYVPIALISAYQPGNAIAEAIRSIRTGVMFSRPEHIPKKILVTSTTSDEGKSTVATNLALILAQSGSNVLIMDADLRKPVIGKWLKLASSSGLAEYLNGEESDIVKPTSFENLFAVPAGGNCRRPTDLLASIRMREYLDAVSERFDFVIVDGPPCLGMADSMLLSAKMDGTLLVVKAGATEKHVVAETVNRLRMVNAPLIGSVLNFVDLQQPEYGHYRQYYGYGDTAGRNEIVHPKGRPV